MFVAFSWYRRLKCDSWLAYSFQHPEKVLDFHFTLFPGTTRYFWLNTMVIFLNHGKSAARIWDFSSERFQFLQLSIKVLSHWHSIFVDLSIALCPFTTKAKVEKCVTESKKALQRPLQSVYKFLTCAQAQDSNFLGFAWLSFGKQRFWNMSITQILLTLYCLSTKKCNKGDYKWHQIRCNLLQSSTYTLLSKYNSRGTFYHVFLMGEHGQLLVTWG